jgi:hypothetical protein
MALLIEAGQMTASDYVPTYPDLPLASKGASTDVSPQPAQTRQDGNAPQFRSSKVFVRIPQAVVRSRFLIGLFERSGFRQNGLAQVSELSPQRRLIFHCNR